MTLITVGALPIEPSCTRCSGGVFCFVFVFLRWIALKKKQNDFPQDLQVMGDQTFQGGREGGNLSLNSCSCPQEKSSSRRGREGQKGHLGRGDVQLLQDSAKDTLSGKWKHTTCRRVKDKDGANREGNS